MLLKGFIVVLCFGVIVAQDISEEQSEEKKIAHFDQDWRVVSEASGWPPQQSSEEHVPKRRRVRKRKRRPPTISLSEEEEFPMKRLHPQEVDGFWKEMSLTDISEKPNVRRRVSPVFDEPAEELTVVEEQKIRDPFTALQEAEEKQKKSLDEPTTTMPDLKTLLKQRGTLSLSEVLQQRNLSLAELLMGNQQAISALTITPEATTEDYAPSAEAAKYKRLPPSIGLKKETDRSYKSEEFNESLTSEEVLEAQRKRLSLLHGHRDSTLFPEVTKFDVVTEQTTEKRIFVPANSKHYISLDFKPDIIMDDEDFNTPPTIRSRPKIPLPMTSASLNKLSFKHSEPTEMPVSAIPIKINEIFGLNFAEKKTIEGPLRISLNLDMNPTEAPKIIIPQKTSIIQVEDIKTTTVTPMGEKMKLVTAKDEIMEILKDPIDRDHLSRILRVRNMTVDQLVEQRERGSSQLHLADIFHNKTREPEPNEEPLIGQIKTDYFTSFPQFNYRKQKSRTIPIQYNEPKTTTPLSVTRPPQDYTITNFPTFKIELNKSQKPVAPPVPQWEEIYPSNLPNRTQSTTTEKTLDNEIILQQREDEAEEEANLLLDYEEEDGFISLPIGVKSAIFASLAIIGLSLIVFLTILVIFKWSQRQKQRLNYMGSLSGSKIRSPILGPDQRRTFKSFVSETLGRKQGQYKSHLQSMSDSIWDTDKKSYMI